MAFGGGANRIGVIEVTGAELFRALFDVAGEALELGAVAEDQRAAGAHEAREVVKDELVVLIGVGLAAAAKEQVLVRVDEEHELKRLGLVGNQLVQVRAPQHRGLQAERVERRAAGG